MKLTLFEPVDGPVTITTPAPTDALLAVGLASEADPAGETIVSRITLKQPDMRIPVGAIPAKDQSGKVVGYVEVDA